MRIGLFQGIVDPPPYVEDQVQGMVDAEADGFDSVWTTETVRAEALTVIAMAGQRTERIEFGTAVVPMHPWLHRHPLTFAQHALTTQAATNGRLTLGIGATRTPTDNGSAMDIYRKPVTHMREFLTILRCLVHEGAVDLSGEIFSVRTTLQVPGASPFPILMAALGPKMLRVAGELADGTVTWMVGPKTLESHIVPRLTSAAEGVGRSAPRVAVGAPVAVTDDDAAGRAASRRTTSGVTPVYRVIAGCSTSRACRGRRTSRSSAMRPRSRGRYVSWLSWALQTFWRASSPSGMIGRSRRAALASC